MARKPQEKLSEQMFDSAGSGFKGKPKKKKKGKIKHPRRNYYTFNSLSLF